jgi:hypothetical protein
LGGVGNVCWIFLTGAPSWRWMTLILSLVK